MKINNKGEGVGVFVWCVVFLSLLICLNNFRITVTVTLTEGPLPVRCYT